MRAALVLRIACVVVVCCFRHADSVAQFCQFQQSPEVLGVSGFCLAEPFLSLLIILRCTLAFHVAFAQIIITQVVTGSSCALVVFECLLHVLDTAIPAFVIIVTCIYKFPCRFLSGCFTGHLLQLVSERRQEIRVAGYFLMNAVQPDGLRLSGGETVDKVLGRPVGNDGIPGGKVDSHRTGDLWGISTRIKHLSDQWVQGRVENEVREKW